MTVNPSNADISIIIPAYNAEPFITKCLESIQQQSFKNYQVLVVDNGSTDHTADKVLPFVSTDNRFKLLHSSDLGVSNARNLALASAQTKFVTFVDADDYISDNHIQTLINCMSDSSVDMGVTGFSYETEDGKALNVISVAGSRMDPEQAIKSTYDFTGIQGIVCNKIFRKSIIEHCNVRFDPSIPKYEDHKFVVEYLIHCQQVACRNEITYHYVKHSQSSLYTSKTNLAQDLEVYLTIRREIVSRGFKDVSDYVERPLQIIVLNHYWHPIDTRDKEEAAKRMTNRKFVSYNLLNMSIKSKLKFLLALLSLGPFWIKQKVNSRGAS